MEIEQIIFTAAYNRLKDKKLPNAKELALYMVAQSKHETANYTSHIFLSSNNAFGYSYTKSSPYQIGKGPIADNKVPAAKYKNVADSAREVADWLTRRIQTFKKVATLKQYADGLKYWGYYGDTEANYLTGLTHFYKDSIEPIINNSDNNV